MKRNKNPLDFCLINRIDTKLPGVFLICPKYEDHSPMLITEGKQFLIHSLYVRHSTFGREEIMTMKNLSCCIGLMRLDFGTAKHPDFMALYKHPDFSTIATSNNPNASMELICVASRDTQSDKPAMLGIRASFKAVKTTVFCSIGDLERKPEDGIIAYSNDSHIVRLWQEDIWAYEEVRNLTETASSKVEEKLTCHLHPYDDAPATGSETYDEPVESETKPSNNFNEILREE